MSKLIATVACHLTLWQQYAGGVIIGVLLVIIGLQGWIVFHD